MNESIKIWLGAAVLFVLFGIVGKMDYTDELEQENAALKIKAAQCQGQRIVFAGRE